MSYVIRGPLPDIGTPGRTAHDGSLPGDVFSNGRWVKQPDGTLLNVPVPSGSAGWFPPSDGHPMPPTPGST